MTGVFISYSRKDSVIAQTLMKEFQSINLDVWVDWEDIPPAVGWLDQILKGIEQADAFLFLVSPDSITSEVCNVELEHAHKNAKRIIPVVVRDVNPKDTVSIIRDLNWIFVRNAGELQKGVDKIKVAINIDVEWLQEHRRLQVRALDWDRQKNHSLLLRGSDLRYAARMVAVHETSDPKPSSLQKLYISSSKRAERINMATIIAAVTAMIIMVFLSYLAFQGQQRALVNERTAQENEKEAVANRKEADRNAAIARAQKVAAEKNAVIAQAQRSAARAQIYQSHTGGLFISTLLAIDSFQRNPSLEAESILRQNINLLPIPVREIEHAGKILEIESSPDGETFASTSEDGSICVSHFEDGETLYCVTSPGSVLDAAFSPGGEVLVTGDSEGVVQILDTKDGSLLKKFEYGVAVQGVNISPEGGLLAIARDDARITLVTLPDYRLYGELSLFGDLRVTAFSPNGQWFAAASDQGSITFWNLSTGQKVNSSAHREEVFEIAFSPDSQKLISGSADNCAVLTSPFSGKELLRVLNEDRVVNVAFSPDGAWFVTASDDFRIRVWDTKTGEERVRLLQDSQIREVMISPNGLWVASTGSDRTVRVWNVANGAEMYQIPLDETGTKLQFSGDSNYLVAGDEDGHVSVWNLSALNANNGYLRFQENIGDVVVDPDGDWIAASAKGQVWLLPPDLYTTQTAPLGSPLLNLGQEVIHDLAINPSGNSLALSTDNGRVLLLNTESGSTRTLIETGPIRQIVFSNDGKDLFMTAADKQVQYRNVTAGDGGIVWQGNKIINSLALSSDNLLALGAEDAVILFDLKTRTVITELAAPGKNQFIRFNPAGDMLATSSASGRTVLWHKQDGQFTKIVEIVSGQISDTSFNANGGRLFIAETDQILIHDPLTGAELDRLRQKGEVTNLIFLQDGAVLLTSSLRTMQFFDLSQMKEITAEDVVHESCSRLLQNFSETEWLYFFEDESYRKMCESLP